MLLGTEHVLLSASHGIKSLQDTTVSAHSPPPVMVISKHSQLIFVEHGVDFVEQYGNGQHPQEGAF